MNVHSRGIQSSDFHSYRFLREGFAHIVCQLSIPAACQNGLCAELIAGRACHNVVDTVGAVNFSIAQFAYRRNFLCCPAAVGNQINHLTDRNLLQKIIPFRVIISKTLHIFNLQVMIYNGNVFGCVNKTVGFIVDCVQSGSTGFTARSGSLFGESSLPIGTAHIACAFAKRSIVKLIGCCDIVSRAGTIVRVVVDSILVDGKSPRINDRVTVAAQADSIFARFENIGTALCFHAGIVVRRHILSSESQSHRFVLTGFNHSSLAKGSENDRTLLDSALSIRCRVVDLDYIFTGNRAVILHIDRHGHIVAVKRKIRDAFFKVRIRKTVAERILNRGVVVNESILSGCFIVSIAYIDTLDIIDIMVGVRSSTADGAGVYPLTVCIVISANAIIAGSALNRIGECIGSATGRIHCTA